MRHLPADHSPASWSFILTDSLCVAPPAAGASTSGVDGQPSVALPPVVPLSVNFMSETGAYLIDNGRVVIFWLGRQVPREFLAEVRLGAACMLLFL